MHVYRCFICNSQQLGTTEMSFNKLMHLNHGILLREKKKKPTDTHNNLDESRGHCVEGEKSQSYSLYDYVILSK